MVMVSLVLDRLGHVLSKSASSNGPAMPLFDEAALAMIRRSDPGAAAAGR